MLSAMTDKAFAILDSRDVFTDRVNVSSGHCTPLDIANVIVSQLNKDSSFIRLGWKMRTDTVLEALDTMKLRLISSIESRTS